MNKRTVMVNFSGGKDSTVAILETLKVYPKNEIILCYQDTGADYLETPAHVELIAKTFDLPLVVLQAKNDWWRKIEERGVFATPNCRSCTNELKKDPANLWIRRHRTELGNELIVVSGIRAEESKRRSLLPEREEHPTTLKNGTFKATTWYPCLHFKEDEIYEKIAAEGLPLHPVYKKAGGFSDRVSCWCCIFQRNSAVREYAEMHPELGEKLINLEQEVKHRWKDNTSFEDVMRQGRLL
jgi:3'-phosphoadenosine 5'-phosphosulfate sulfotransferase (PAPS reductase)/FAD synthetase